MHRTSKTCLSLLTAVALSISLPLATAASPGKGERPGTSHQQGTSDRHGDTGAHSNAGAHSNGADGKAGRGGRVKDVRLRPLGSFRTGQFDEAAAEISSFDPADRRLFVVNAQSGAIDVLDASDPAALHRRSVLTVAGQRAADGSVVDAGASVNSVKVHGRLLAVAVQAGDKVSPGWALFYSTAGEYLGGVRVGSLPDMITVTADGRYALTANEGEPADDFSSDPEGSVSVIDLGRGAAGIGQHQVRTARFTGYDAGRPVPAGVRVFGPDVPVPAGQPAAGRVARNLEPEYIVAPTGSGTAYVTLQEANAVAAVDLRRATVSDLWAMPGKDNSLPRNAFDASDKDGAVNLLTWPTHMLLLPDSIASYRYRGTDLLVTANEGDAREWGDYAEPVRVKKAELCADRFPDAAQLQRDDALGRLNMSSAGPRSGGCYTRIEVFGGRSFAILSTDGTPVFESGALMERTISGLIEDGRLPGKAWNANNTDNDSFDGRSDDKGPEPEGLAIGKVSGRSYAFVGLERIGGVMTFDITDPRQVRFVDYAGNRDWAADNAALERDGAGDLGPEGIEFVSADDSPTAAPLVIVANEISGSTTAYQVQPVR